MSVEHMAVVLHHSKASGTAKVVALGIANHAGDGGAWPSMATLAKYANVSAKSARRAVQWLIEHGEIVSHVQGGGLPNAEDHLRTNRYDILVTCPHYCDRTPNHRDMRPKQRHLWIDPLPGMGAPPKNGRGTPPTDGSRTIPRTGTNQGGASVTGPHARAGDPSPQGDPTPCNDCGKDETTCRATQAAYPADARHTYLPNRGREA